MKGIEKSKLKGMENQETEHKTDTYETSAGDIAYFLYAILLAIAMFFMIIDLSQRVESISSSKEQTTQSTTLAPQLPTDQ